MSTVAALPTVTVVIATRNRSFSVSRAVLQVLAQDYERLQVRVVDDGSTDDTLDALASIDDPRLEVVQSPGRGASAARNFGAVGATGDYLVFLDDDDAVKPGWLRALMEVAAEADADLVSCAVERVDRAWQHPVVDQPTVMSPIFSRLRVQFLAGAFAIRRDLFEEVGGYPEDLPSNQQTGLALRVAARHDTSPVRTAVTPFVGVVWHQRRRGPGGVPASFARSRLHGTLTLLDQYPERFARDPRERANYLSAAATCAARLGELRTARRLYWRAFRSWPGRRRDLLRWVVALSPWATRRVWPVLWDEEPGVAEPRAARPRRVVEVAQSIAGSAAVPSRVRAEIGLLLDAGDRVTVVTNDPPDPATAPATARVVVVGPRRAWLRRSSVKPTLLGWRARTVVHDARPDLVIVHHPVTAWLVRKEARHAGARTIAVVHSLVHDERRRGANPHRPLTTLLGLLGERRLRELDVVAPVSESLTATLRCLGVRPERICPVPNVVDTGRFHPGSVPRDIDVLYVGRLSPEKGPQDLLAACAVLPERTRVVIAGSGSLRAELEQQAGALPCQVDFTGHVPDDQLAVLYRRARVVVVPSRSEALGMVVLEALASGTPVIGTRVGGIPELVQPDVNGWLVEPGDTVGLGAAIAAALDGDLRPASEAARRSVAGYAPDRFEERFSALVSTVDESR